MKQGCTYKKLGEVCDFRSGFAFKSSKFTKNGEPIIRISDIQNEEIDESNLVYFDPKSYKEDLSKYIIYPDDILIAMSGGTTGKLGLNKSNRTFYLNQRVGVFRENKQYIDHRYLFYYLHTKSEESLRIAAGAAQPNLSTAQIKDFVIPIPPLSEQQRIVSRLDSAFAHINELKANAEKQVNEARALFQKALSKAMEPKEGWEEKTLGETAKYRRGSFPQPYGNKEWYDGEGSMPFVQVAELQEDSFNMIPVTKRRISKIAQPLSVFVPAGTVLVSLQGSIGKVAITNYDSYVDRTIAIFQDYKININKKFFAFQLKIRFEIERLKARGTTIKTITKEEFANFIIYCPSLPEQQRIVERLDSLSKNVKALEENQRKVIAECDALKQALLRKVFE